MPLKPSAGCLLLLLCAAGACSRNEAEQAPPSLAPAPASVTAPRDSELDACRERVRAFEKEPALPGAPEFDSQRVEILGRARGEPAIWVDAPMPTPDAALGEQALALRSMRGKTNAIAYVRRAVRTLSADKAELRALLLKQGYVFSSDPADALALVVWLKLPDLFDEPVIYQQRANQVHKLARKEGRPASYVEAEGENAGRPAELLFGDRVALDPKQFAEPLHRDLRSLARTLGFDRATVERRGKQQLLVKLRFGTQWARALLDSDEAGLELGCLDEPQEVRQRVARFQAQDAPRRRALAELHAAVDRQLSEGLPFDRPRGEQTADRDGQLRPAWRWAYKSGQRWFSFEDNSYPVYDQDGRPRPPQVCVDFVLDSYERGAGSWYRALGEAPARVVGALDFDSFGIKNRRGVLAFEKFAEETPELFEHMRIPADQRVRFLERSRYFAYLQDHADLFQPGDVIAIQGRKADGKIHQHAILIEDTDPVTGFPDALADQMRVPRRRTWEGIMAEAPLRSLLYRVRPKPKILLSLDPERTATVAAR